MRKTLISAVFLRLRPKLVFLAVSWLCAIGIVVFCSTNYKFNQAGNNIAENTAMPAAHQNGLGGFATWRCDPKANHRPIYSVAFKNFCAENASLGVFKTASHKVVKIEDLQAKFFRYPSDGRFDSAQASPLTAFSTLSDPEDNGHGEMTLAEMLDKFKDTKRPWSLSIDLSNVSEVRLKNLDYQIFDNGTLSLGVQCKRALATYNSPEIILRGYARITAADGSTLESNHIRWDTKKCCFKADGTYFLTRNGKKIRGEDICVDDKLNIVQAQIAALKEGSKENG
jgi:hypothetical protein